MRRTPELTQFESAKSMMRNLPPNGTAGFARQSVSGPRREPRPPASTSAMVLCVRRRSGSISTELVVGANRLCLHEVPRGDTASGWE